ncbi:MAG: Lrp/AsnC family transcriptional regulator [Candidatus Heimdallarchaeum aukensis]|uniref:Lrp/AsnC family transcriptional regulator n=2 Tax=Candidatus Heimdallarchaeum TaxID=3053649 RepID=A0A9Y1BT11_9ARCH|nr:MAG: Lrp/AsnC family transcriptional regulator [Candidatus Heimdallarchaeum aukensis]UJG44432.1 MAG: Lrp/AsnC family transcriptional regulator [Candidatus Heimdallarchaeum endolithica]
MDSVDEKIIKILQSDSRLSARAIAKKMNIAPSTVLSRIKKLEEKKIIRDYTITLDYANLGYDVPVIIDVKVSKGKLFEVENEIAKSKNVIAVYDVTGDFDVVVLAIFKTRKGLDQFIKKLQAYKYVERTNTKLILNTIKDSSTIKI